jgi:gas vesicle protein
MADRSSGADFLIGFVIGGLAGAAAALLLAPQSGEDTRALIRERSIELQERSAEMTAEARRRARELELQATDRASEWQSRMQEAVADGRTAGAQKKEELLTGLDAEDSADQDLDQV